MKYLDLKLLAIGICIVAYLHPTNVALRAKAWWIGKQVWWMKQQIHYNKCLNLLMQRKINRIRNDNQSN